MSKICGKCGQEKDNDEFFKQHKANDGLQLYCKECKKISRDYQVKKPLLKPILISILPELDEDYHTNLSALILNHPGWIQLDKINYGYALRLIFIISDKINITEHYKYIPELVNDYNIKSLTTLFKLSGDEHNRLILHFEATPPTQKEIRTTLRDRYWIDEMTLPEIAEEFDMHVTVISYYVFDDVEYMSAHGKKKKRI